MSKNYKQHKKEIGLSPQELVFRGDQKIDQTSLHIINFDEKDVHEQQIIEINEIEPYLTTESITWLNINGLHDLNLLKNIGEKCNLSNLMLSDVLETNARPKIHEYDNWVFISIKMLQFQEETNSISTENFSLIFNENMLISFQEKKGDVFEPVRERIRHQKRTLRSSRGDYLVFALLDTIIDHYLYILSMFSDKIESFDEVLLEEADKKVFEVISNYKKELIYIRRSIKPAKEMILSLSKLESDFKMGKNQVHFKELVNNINQASDTLDNLRELLSDQLNVYHMMISSKLNDIIKFLTIFSVLFIPLTFIAGIYGTNFDVLPELHFKHGYFIMLGVMAVIAISMLLFFKRKKWL